MMVTMMRNIETFPSKQMYPYLSLVERKEAEFYHNIDRRRCLVWLKWIIFITIWRELLVSLQHMQELFAKHKPVGCNGGSGRIPV